LRALSDKSVNDHCPDGGRSQIPRFSGENLALVAALGSVAGCLGASVVQVAVAWVLSRGVDIVPVIGARRPERLAGALAAVGLTLAFESLAEVERAVPVGVAAGDRCAARHMTDLGSVS